MVAREYDYWLLDLDGTLIDVDWSYPRSVFDRVGDRLGREFSDREAEILWHGLGGNRNDQLREWGIDPQEFWPAFHDIEDPQRRSQRPTAASRMAASRTAVSRAPPPRASTRATARATWARRGTPDWTRFTSSATATTGASSACWATTASRASTSCSGWRSRTESA